MSEENDLMDSLLREHAKSQGVDEKFLSELEAKLDAEDDVNVIPISGSARKASVSKSKTIRGLGVGIAACAALCVGGSMLWKKNNLSSETIAINSEAADMQIERANEEVQNYISPAPASIPLEAEAPPQDGVAIRSIDHFSGDSKGGGIEDSLPRSESKMKYAPKKAYSGKGRDVLNDVYQEKRGPISGRAGSDNESAAGLSVPESITKANELPRLNKHLELDEDRSIVDSNSEKYGKLIENDFTAPIDKESKRSTFSIDVDTASYANVRRMITSGSHVPVDSVRIEEMINYFDYQYKRPAQNGKHPFAVHVDAAECPWNENNKLVRIALQGKEVIRAERPASNVVFLLDVSGSMNRANKLPLLKESLKYLLEEMNEKDTISIVVYAGASGLVLPATKVDDVGRSKILKSMEKLGAGGSTAGGAGIKLAYKLAKENLIIGGVNRVILATDGDFNVGVTDPEMLKKIVKKEAMSGVDISVLGFGTGNLNDKMLELITNNGNGNYSYIDTIKEGRKVLLEDMMGTLVTIAKDVKIQVEFNPEKVKEYRLIGYSNRVLPNAAFLDKTADAGEVGAGHRVTAFYEIVSGRAADKSKMDDLRYAKKKKPEEEADVESEYADELLNVKLAYKRPEQKMHDESTYLFVPLKDEVMAWEQADEDFKFGSSVALFGMILRESDHKGDGDLNLALKLAESGKGADGKGLRSEFINLIKKLKDEKDE